MKPCSWLVAFREAAGGVRRRAGVTLLAALGVAANAQFMEPGTNHARSVSGQFCVQFVSRPFRAPPPPALANHPDYLKLDPAMTAISCERIRRALTGALGDKSPWRDKIHLVLYPAQSADDGATIVAERFRDGWQYRLELPDPVERTRFVRAIAQVVLQEMAGRRPGDHAPEIPAWLAEGLAQHLLRSDESDLLPPPPRWAVNNLMISPVVVGAGNRGAPRGDPLAPARRNLREHAPLTLAELSWPADETSGGATPEAYSSSAQLFVTELLRLNDGRACLRAMIDGLAECYNWQTAFLRAFRGRFERLVDLEKWWALQVVHFTGRDFAHTWSLEESWAKLDDILRTPVEVRRARSELPGRADISLATVIREWDFFRQSQTLRAKARELDLLRMRVAPGLIALVDDYRRVLAAYLERRDRAGAILPGSKLPSPGANFVVRDTLKQLADLEHRREDLRPQPSPVSAAQVTTDPTTSP